MIRRFFQRIKESSGFFAYTDPEGKHHRGKTLWDLLGLIILPVLLAGGVYWLNQQQQIRVTQIETDRQQEQALLNYLAVMSQLLLDEDKGLKNSKEGDPVRIVARSLTLTTLRTLDPTRKGLLVSFLHEAELINKEPDTVVPLVRADLYGADLYEADLIGANLSGADLSWSDLSGADLSDTDLNDANLSFATLFGADLHFADLRFADLSFADLTYATLEGADLSLATLRGARYDNETKWPDGFDPEAAGAIQEE